MVTYSLIMYWMVVISIGVLAIHGLSVELFHFLSDRFVVRVHHLGWELGFFHPRLFAIHARLAVVKRLKSNFPGDALVFEVEIKLLWVHESGICDNGVRIFPLCLPIVERDFPEQDVFSTGVPIAIVVAGQVDRVPVVPATLTE